MTDVFYWRMNAAMHRTSVAALVAEIRDSQTKKQPLPLSIITTLLPLATPQREEIAKRGNFEWVSEQSWENRANTELRVQLDDPAMGTFFALLPAHWKGSVEGDESELELTFDTPLELEIPKLAELGLGRSAFQLFVSITVSAELAESVLDDGVDQSKETRVQAILGDFLNVRQFEGNLKVRVAELFSLGRDCGTQDKNDPNWYVYRRINGGLCFIHYGTVIDHAEIYQYVFGPGTYEEASRAEQQSCW